MATQDLHRNAFWVLGAIVAVAIKDPLSQVVSALIERGPTDWRSQLEVWRLALALITVLRFYLGAGAYFENTYFSSRLRPSDPYAYPIDFMFALMHFLVIFGWCESISVHNYRAGGEFSYFLVGLFAVLLYDNAWCFGTRNIEGRAQIQHWTELNDYTVLCCLMLYAVVRGGGLDPVASEYFAFLPAVAVAIMDLDELFREHRI